MLALVAAAALAAASPVPALEAAHASASGLIACTGASAALAAHHCTSLRDLFARAAIVHCLASDPCGCWCAHARDASTWRQAEQLCSATCHDGVGLPLAAAAMGEGEAMGDRRRRLDLTWTHAASPIDRSGHREEGEEHHIKLWYEPACAPSRLNMALAARLPVGPHPPARPHRCPLYRCPLLDGSQHPRTVLGHAWGVLRDPLDSRLDCVALTEGIAGLSQLVRPAVKPQPPETRTNRRRVFVWASLAGIATLALAVRHVHMCSTM